MKINKYFSVVFISILLLFLTSCNNATVETQTLESSNIPEQTIEEVPSEIWKETESVVYVENSDSYTKKDSTSELYKISEDNTFVVLTTTTKNCLTGTWENYSLDRFSRLKNNIKESGYEFELTECYSLHDVSGTNYFFKTNNPEYAVYCGFHEDYFDILISSSIDEFNSSYSNAGSPSYKSSDLECQYKYATGTRCGALCTDHDTFCNQHFDELLDTYKYVEDKFNNSSKNYDYEIELFYMEIKQ